MTGMEDEWRNDPSKWILGVFYYNKDDHRIFPPKRIPWMGWTINFANPYAVMGLIILFAVMLVMVVLF